MVIGICGWLLLVPDVVLLKDSIILSSWCELFLLYSPGPVAWVATCLPRLCPAVGQSFFFFTNLKASTNLLLSLLYELAPDLSCIMNTPTPGSSRSAHIFTSTSSPPSPGSGLSSRTAFSPKLTLTFCFPLSVRKIPPASHSLGHDQGSSTSRLVWYQLWSFSTARASQLPEHPLTPNTNSLNSYESMLAWPFLCQPPINPHA